MVEAEAPPIVTKETTTTHNTIILKAVDEQGIIGYAVTENNIAPTNFTSCISTTKLTQEVIGKTPNTTYYVWVKDVNGHVSEGKQVKTRKIITYEEVEQDPMKYYGAYVNYTDTNGNSFKTGTREEKWRIFYANEHHIYLVMNNSVSGPSPEDPRALIVFALQYLRSENQTYINKYAEWSKNGITYTMLRDSYNQVRRDNPEQNLEGSEEEGFYVPFDEPNNTLSELLGTTQEKLYIGGGMYYLATMRVSSHYALIVGYGGQNIDCRSYIAGYNSRPIVCLKSDVQLVEYDGIYGLTIPE